MFRSAFPAKCGLTLGSGSSFQHRRRATPPDLRPERRSSCLPKSGADSYGKNPHRIFAVSRALVNPARNLCPLRFCHQRAPPAWQRTALGAAMATRSPRLPPPPCGGRPNPLGRRAPAPLRPGPEHGSRARMTQTPASTSRFSLIPRGAPCRWEAGETRILARQLVPSQHTPFSIPQARASSNQRSRLWGPVSLRPPTLCAAPGHEVHSGLGDS